MLADMLRALAKGINPETGEDIDENSVINSVQSVRLLFEIADEIDCSVKPSIIKSKKKLNDIEKRIQNEALGRPARSHFPWEINEIEKLKSRFLEKMAIELIAEQFERSKSAICAELLKLNLISKDDMQNLLYKKTMV